jgi:hypothetical protein
MKQRTETPTMLTHLHTKQKDYNYIGIQAQILPLLHKETIRESNLKQMMVVMI